MFALMLLLIDPVFANGSASRGSHSLAPLRRGSFRPKPQKDKLFGRKTAAR